MRKGKINSLIPPVRSLSKKKVLLFKTISFLLPFLILCLFEISLRIFHYGHDLNLFIEYRGDKNYLVFNPDASKKYFTNQANATTGNSEIFKNEKDGNTLRIFVLGESTTIGYPYFHNGSFHRWLQYRLISTFPDRNFEIINLSLTAVNSYTVLGFAKEVVKYEPDAVLIYTGHNEYYGALGVGSTENIGGNPYFINLILHLREWRITQLMTNVYEEIGKLLENPGKNSAGETRMKLMVAEQQIPWQSKLFKRGIDQFRRNLEETLNIFNQRHIPVFVSNLVSNEKDMQPFISVQVNSVQYPGFKRNYLSGLKFLENKNLPAAYANFKKADEVYAGHALCNYYLGQLAYQLGDYQKAKIYFSKARDLDCLRFRAPDEMNKIIEQLCNKYQNSHLVDTKAAFEANCNHYIIGNELILEHVHPNLEGYALISDVFYETMKKEQLISVSKEKEMSFRQLLQVMPITSVDSLTGVFKVFKLTRSWPFNELPHRDSITVQSEEEKLAYGITFKQISWAGAMDNLYNYYMKDRELEKARNVLESLALENPPSAKFYEKLGMLNGELKDYEKAVLYFKKAFALDPSFEKARYLFVIYFKLDQPANAIPYLDYAIHNNTQGLNLLPVKAFAEEILQFQKQYSKDSTDVQILNKIADRYLKMGNKDGAAKYAEKVVKMDSKNKEAILLLSNIKK